MNISSEKTESGTLLTLAGELNIYKVAECKQELFADIDSYQSPVTMDLSAIGEIDTAGVQLLLFAKKILGEANKELRIIKSNDQVDNVLTMLDLTHQFAMEQ